MDSNEETEGMDHIPYSKIKDSLCKETPRSEDKCCPVLWHILQITCTAPITQYGPKM